MEMVWIYGEIFIRHCCTLYRSKFMARLRSILNTFQSAFQLNGDSLLNGSFLTDRVDVIERVLPPAKFLHFCDVMAFVLHRTPRNFCARIKM